MGSVSDPPSGSPWQRDRGEEEVETMSMAKEEAKKLLEAIPDNATWDDIIYQFYVTKKVEESLRAVDAGEIVPQEEMERMFPAE
jgi:hypothetical protein